MLKRAGCLMLIVIPLLMAACGGDNGTKSEKAATWETNIGGSAFEVASRVVRTGDGAFVIAGTAGNAAAADVYVVKVNSSGETVWEQTIGGSGQETVRSLETTSDGGYLIAGATNSMGYGGFDTYVLKLTPDGHKQWEQAYGGNGDDDAIFARQAEATGYLMIGTTRTPDDESGSLLALRLTSTGAADGSETLVSDTNHVADAGARTADGGAVLVGQRTVAGSSFPGLWVLAVDATGALLWQNSFGSEILINPSAIIQTADGGYVIAGEAWPAGQENSDAYLAKTDAAGNLQWEKTFGSDKDDAINGLRQTADGGYILAGSTEAKLIQGTDVYLVKTDASGDIVWERTFGGESFDEGYDVDIAEDGGFVIAGRTASFGTGGGDFYVIRTDANGEL
jgi:hypothetical protein